VAAIPAGTRGPGRICVFERTAAAASLRDVAKCAHSSLALSGLKILGRRRSWPSSDCRDKATVLTFERRDIDRSLAENPCRFQKGYLNGDRKALNYSYRILISGHAGVVR